MLRSDNTGRLVSVSGSGPLISGGATTPGNPEKFDMLDLGSGQVAFRSHQNRKFVTAPGYNQQLRPDALTLGGAQQFTMAHWVTARWASST